MKSMHDLRWPGGISLAAVFLLSSLPSAFAQEHADGHDSHVLLGMYAAPGPSPGGQDLDEPLVLRSQGGKLEVDLIVRYETHQIGGSTAKLRTYVEKSTGAKAVFGPTMRVGPDDRLIVTIHNQLPPNPHAMSHGHNDPHDFNSTNLHTHGLHVSPSEDDVFRRIDPGDFGRYSYTLQNHVSGTNWYHPHLHGSTAMQVAGGMSGVLIVEGDFDHVPEIRRARERVLLFNQVVFHRANPAATGELEDFAKLFNALPPEGTTINGQVKPVIHMRPGEVQRWRIVHSGFRQALAFKLEGHDFHQISVDGIPLEYLRTTSAIGMAPGNRTDILVRAAEKPGDYYLRPTTYDPAFEYDFDDGAPPPVVKDAKEAPEDYLAIVRVSGPPARDTLPASIGGARRPAFIPAYAISNATAPRRIEFTLDPDPAAPTGPPRPPAWITTKFGINHERFDANRLDHTLQVGLCEVWEISGAGHPFHIHTNPFLVTEVNGRRLSQPVWKDVVLVPPTANASARFRTRYDDFTGEAVLHCHILTHEDVGMMQRIRFTR
jgi:FtsP/CotA-like multicopper oxidase with cupredoxin domain